MGTATRRLAATLLVAAHLVAMTPFITAAPASAAHVALLGDAPSNTAQSNTAPEGTDTTDPESSAEDATAPPAWRLWAALGAGAAVVVVYVVRSRRGADSAEP